MAGAFFAGTFFAGAFFAAALLAGAFFTGAFFAAAAFGAAAEWPRNAAADSAARWADFARRLRSRSFIALPRSAGDLTVRTPAASSARNLSAAVPLPPEITAPAWPMRLPGGAVTPAM